MSGMTPEQLAAEFEKIADALWTADFLLVLVGPLFDEGGVKNPFDNERCNPNLVSQPNRFMGFWGGVFNSYSDRSPHEGFAIVSRWRDRFYCQDDMRKKGKKKGGDEELTDFDRMAKCLVYTANIGNQFQRLGLPTEEVFDALGNVTTWQCSRTPPCCQRVFPVERNFRFVIDDATKEAMPVKYIAQRAREATMERVVVVDSDDEELVALEGGRIKNSFEQKLPKEEQMKRQQRRACQPRVVHHHHQTQAQQAKKRFPDLFTGYALELAQRPQPFAFYECPVDPQSARRVPPIATDAPLLPMTNPVGLRRCSHLFEHMMALDCGALAASVGAFYVTDTERFTKEREQSYMGIGKRFTAENPSLLGKRAQFAQYNISVMIQEPGQRVVPDTIREKLLTVYGRNPKTVPVIAKAGGSGSDSVVVGSIHPADAAQLDLHRQCLDPWYQGRNGCFYFSNQSPRQTMYDQTTDHSIDVVRVSFPAAHSSPTLTKSIPSSAHAEPSADETPAATVPEPVAPLDEPYVLPNVFTISIICETVIEVAQVPPLEGQKAPPLQSAGSCPTRVVNTWQIAGQCVVTPATFSDPDLKGKDVVELILVGRAHHGVRIGVEKATQRVVFMDFQCPTSKEDEVLDDVAEGGGVLGAAFVSHVSHTKVRHVPVSKSAASSNGDRPPIPAPNHQLCANCHDVARPFVLMSKPGLKDEGFCHALQAARVKQVKGWEKLMTDCLKNDNTKSIVMLELGCDRKADPVKQYSEKTFKTLKQSKCTHVRISNQDLETKGKKGGSGETTNAIALVTSPVQALVTLDNLLGERLRKGK